ncbi:unnamed protein product [Cyclocybe aegerita]|uniref:WSC domain-containing protein n=1 Tax=Cyclocybe aegerita TaxID=1973307 RepID=A0A8S0WTU5_CYCAE|nr:unnamed protein product [Cyclocybe aegerita]
MVSTSFARLALLAYFVGTTVALPSKPSAESVHLYRRQDEPNPNGPLEGWTYVGCFTDIASSRTLLEAVTVDPVLTPAICTEFCQGTTTAPTGFNFAGTEFTSECYCDFNIQGTATQVDDEECSFACAGDPTLNCGGFGRVSVYTNGGAPPTNKEQVGTWVFSGCHTDAVGGNGRTLLERFDIPEGTSIESCTAQCEATGYSITGLEFGRECWCGNEFLVEDTEAPLGECSMTCIGDHTELCGAGSRLSVYINTVVVEPTVEPTPDPTVVEPTPDPTIVEPTPDPTVVDPTVVEPTIVEPTVEPTVVEPPLEPTVTGPEEPLPTVTTEPDVEVREAARRQ